MKAFLRVGDGPAQVRGARALDAVPEMEDLFEAGGCGPEHVAALASVVRDIDPEVLAAGAGKLLAEQAADLAPDDFKRAAGRIRDHFDPDAADRRTPPTAADQLADCRTGPWTTWSRCRACSTPTPANCS